MLKGFDPDAVVEFCRTDLTLGRPVDAGALLDMLDRPAVEVIRSQDGPDVGRELTRRGGTGRFSRGCPCRRCAERWPPTGPLSRRKTRVSGYNGAPDETSPDPRGYLMNPDVTESASALAGAWSRPGG
jgi:hypothetical protein